MAKKYSHKRKHRTHNRTMRQKGGDLSGNPASSWGWVQGTLGGGWDQFRNALTLQPGANLGASQSNSIVPIGRVNAQNAQGNIGPNMKGDVPQSGGRRHKRRGKRGGSFGTVLAQAAVPGTLVAMRYLAKTRKNHKKSSRRHR